MHHGGRAWPRVKDELIAIAARRDELQRQHAAISEPKPLLQPEMAAIYRAKATELRRALQATGARERANRRLFRKASVPT